MIEGSISTIVRIFITFLSVMVLAGIGISLFQLQQTNHFKQYVNYEIERNGGLTSQAMQRINNYSQEHFNGRFKVQSSQGNQKYPYGSVIEYKVVTDFNVPFLEKLNIDTPTLVTSGAALSLVR